MALRGALGRRWSPLVACDAAALCVAGVALGDIHLRFTWQAWHLVTSTFVLRGRRGTYGTAWHAWTALSPVTPRQVSHTIFVTHHLSHTTLSHTFFHTPSLTHPLSRLFRTPSLSHAIFHTRSFTPTLSHTIFHTPLCHPSSLTHHLSHKLCHTPSLTLNFVTQHFVTHHL